MKCPVMSRADAGPVWQMVRTAVRLPISMVRVKGSAAMAARDLARYIATGEKSWMLERLAANRIKALA